MKKTIKHYSGAKWKAVFDGILVRVYLDDGSNVTYTTEEVIKFLFTGTWEIVND